MTNSSSVALTEPAAKTTTIISTVPATHAATVQTNINSSCSQRKSNTTNTNNNNTNSYDILDTGDDEFLLYDTQPRSLAALAERDRLREQLYLQQQAKQQQQQQPTQDTKIVNNNSSNDQQQQQKKQHTTLDMTSGSGASIQPNAIDISTAMIVNEKVTQTNVDAAQPHKHCDAVDDSNKSKLINNNFGKTSVNNNNLNSALSDNNIRNDKKRKMEKSTKSAVVSVHSSPVSSPDKSDSFNKSDKKNKSGFLSRFTGFRFSLRGNKKKLKSYEINAPETGANNIVLVSKSATIDGSGQVPVRTRNNDNSRAGLSYQRNSMRSNDFVYIPLKEPTSATAFSDNNLCDNTRHHQQQQQTNNINNAKKSSAPIEEKKHVLTGKPPLPRQPPRVVGVCAKQSTNPSQINNKAATIGAGLGHAHQQRSTSAPREIHSVDGKNFHFNKHNNDYNDDDEDDVDFYYNQLRAGTRLNKSAGAAGLTSAISSDGILLMDNNHDDSTYTEDSFCTTDDEHGKIGLIETNLDTDETIISGKTRSLMELGPQQLTNCHRAQGGVARRLGRNGASSGRGATGSNIEPRRPHKSMEFLLDKENQRFVLVSSKC